MCGIIGYIGRSNGIPHVLSSLEHLEYRGYDSCGIGFADKDKHIRLFKDIGRVNNLEKLVGNAYFSNIVIGHTRWATTGKVTKNNAHPHSSYNGRFCLVHNGVIDNYQEIKDKYLKDITFVSDTDSEVIASLLEKLIEKHNNDLLDCFNELIDILEGSYALVIIDRLVDKLYFIKNKTPLLVGKGDDFNALCSDVSGFPKGIIEYIPLEDYQYGYIGAKDLEIYGKSQRLCDLSWCEMDKDCLQEDDKCNSTYMYKEILEEKSIISRLLSSYANDNKFIFGEDLLLKIKDCDTLYLFGCGTSYNACLVGKHYFENISGIRCEVHIASEAIDNLKIFAKNPSFLFVSQSGETLDVLLLIEKIKKIYGKESIISIINTPHSSIDRASGYRLYLGAGKEVSVASTKCYLAEIVLFYMLANSLVENLDFPSIKKDLLDCEKEIRRVILEEENVIKNKAKELAKSQEIFFLGKGLTYFLSCECSLKMKEITYLHCESYCAGELKHGPLSLLNCNSSVISFVNDGENAKKIRSNILECLSRGAKCDIFSLSKFSSKKDCLTLVSGSEHLSIMNFAIIGQLLAYYVAEELGNDVDRPRNLAKSVTVE